MAEIHRKPDLGEAAERVYRSQIHDVVGPEFCYNLTLFVGVMTMYTVLLFSWTQCIYGLRETSFKFQLPIHYYVSKILANQNLCRPMS